MQFLSYYHCQLFTNHLLNLYQCLANHYQSDPVPIWYHNKLSIQIYIITKSQLVTSSPLVVANVLPIINLTMQAFIQAVLLMSVFEQRLSVQVLLNPGGSLKVLYTALQQVCTTNPFQQLLPKEEDLPVWDLQKWKIIPNRKIKDLYQKAIKSEAVSL